MNSIRLYPVLGAAVLLAAGPAAASDLNYNYVEARFVSAELDGDGGPDIDGDGFEFEGMFAINENFHAFASFTTLEFDFDVDASAFVIGAGYNTPVADGTDLVARVSYVNGEVDTPFGDADDSGLGLSAGFRHAFTPQFEAAAYINHVDLDESGSDTSFEVEGEYFFTDRFAAGVNFEFGDEETVIGIGGRLYFEGVR